MLAVAVLAPAAASVIEIDDAGLTTSELAASQALVRAALDHLPPGMRDALDGRVALRWRDDLPDDVHGRVHGGRIGLRRELLATWMQRGDDEAFPHPALSALLHELAHVHDRSPQGGLSRDPRLRDLAGWPVRPLRLGLRTRRSGLRDRSPDTYELRSPAEFVAVNLEHFLLDPEYACRRSALHRHFSAHFAWAPAAPACAPDLPFVGAGMDDEALRVIDIDPARVVAVDYLFAEANNRPMSRWGHSMLRLVVCAPGREPGADCRLDLDHHLVLSFRAFVDDVQVSSWRGLTGSYPSRLFVLPLQQVIDEYTKVELRGLQSVPLRLDRDEIAALLERAAQVHWSYDGRYYFVSNNCAVETWKLLNDGVPRLSRSPLRSITPNGLLRRLQREGIADGSVLDDAPRATREGYYFPSQAAHFGQMFEVADVALGLPAEDAQAWMDLAPPARAPWLQRGDLRTTAALLLLEQAALRREEAAAREALKQRFLRGEGHGSDAASAFAALREIMGNDAQGGRPSTLLDTGYGVPQADERQRLAHAVASDDARLRTLQGGLQLAARKLLPQDRQQRLQNAERNVATLGTHLRALHAGQARP